MGRKRKTNEKFVEEIHELVKDEYIFLEKYIKSKTKILCRHNKCGHEWKVKPNQFLRGSRCPNCHQKAKKSNKQFVKEVYEFVGDEYEFLEKYKGIETKILCKHKKCNHKWKIKPKHRTAKEWHGCGSAARRCTCFRPEITSAAEANSATHFFNTQVGHEKPQATALMFCKVI
jgi:hypothetical protein